MSISISTTALATLNSIAALATEKGAAVKTSTLSAVGYEIKQLYGTIPSLVKKGLVVKTELEKVRYIALTDLGYEVLGQTQTSDDTKDTVKTEKVVPFSTQKSYPLGSFGNLRKGDKLWSYNRVEDMAVEHIIDEVSPIEGSNKMVLVVEFEDNHSTAYESVCVDPYSISGEVNGFYLSKRRAIEENA